MAPSAYPRQLHARAFTSCKLPMLHVQKRHACVCEQVFETQGAEGKAFRLCGRRGAVDAMKGANHYINSPRGGSGGSRPRSSKPPTPAPPCRPLAAVATATMAATATAPLDAAAVSAATADIAPADIAPADIASAVIAAARAATIAAAIAAANIAVSEQLNIQLS